MRKWSLRLTLIFCRRQKPRCQPAATRPGPRENWWLVPKGRPSKPAGISFGRDFWGPSGDYLGQIFLSSLSSGLIDRRKNIFQPGLLGIKTDGEKVFLGVIGYCHDASEGGDAGAHGVRATASDKPAALHHARHPEI